MTCFTVNRLVTLSQLVLAGGLFAPSFLLAQNPAAVPANLKYTRAAFTRNHLIARVELRVGENKYVRFQYDRYPDIVRVKTEDGVTYARLKAGPWLKSDDWGETGTPVKADKARELDTNIEIAELPLGEGQSLDKTQGGTVWNLVGRTKNGLSEDFTYERSRERPRAGGVYPRYTFVKFKDDSDGKLLLSHYSGQMRTDKGVIPIETQFDLLIRLPPGSVKIEISPDLKKRGRH